MIYTQRTRLRSAFLFLDSGFIRHFLQNIFHVNTAILLLYNYRYYSSQISIILMVQTVFPCLMINKTSFDVG